MKGKIGLAKSKGGLYVFCESEKSFVSNIPSCNSLNNNLWHDKWVIFLIIGLTF